MESGRPGENGVTAAVWEWSPSAVMKSQASSHVQGAVVAANLMGSHVLGNSKIFDTAMTSITVSWKVHGHSGVPGVCAHHHVDPTPPVSVSDSAHLCSPSTRLQFPWLKVRVRRMLPSGGSHGHCVRCYRGRSWWWKRNGHVYMCLPAEIQKRRNPKIPCLHSDPLTF